MTFFRPYSEHWNNYWNIEKILVAVIIIINIIIIIIIIIMMSFYSFHTGES